MAAPLFISEAIAIRKSARTYVSGSTAHPNMVPSGGFQLHLFVDCAGELVDLSINDTHCGNCSTSCGKGETCCGGGCAPRNSNCGGCGAEHACPPGTTCCAVQVPEDGRPPTYKCVDLTTDQFNCGACSNPCTPYFLDGRIIEGCCSDGACLTQKDIQTNPHHCGSCHNDCIQQFGSNHYCSQGHCCENCKVWYAGNTILRIPAGCYPCTQVNGWAGVHFECCDGGPGCSDLNNDPLHCGSCGHPCYTEGAHMICSGGKCICPPDFTDKCSGECGSLMTGTTPDHGQFHCGNCNTICKAGFCCSNGVCKDINTDPMNCGSCGHTCPPGFGCCAGNCVDFNSRVNCGGCNIPCNIPGHTCCNGECRNISENGSNCGSCGHDCYLYGGFANGKNYCCNGQCLDLLSDDRNCGECGKQCPPGQTCSNAVCQTTL